MKNDGNFWITLKGMEMADVLLGKKDDDDTRWQGERLKTAGVVRVNG